MDGSGNDETSLSIGELSEKTGCPIETIRYYERAGVLSMPPRTPSGRRVYGEPHVRQLMFVRRARELGFSLERTRALLMLAQSNGEACPQAQSIATAHLREVQQRISELQHIAGRLHGILEECRGEHREAACPVLAALGAGGAA